jgi:hypothetical protein
MMGKRIVFSSARAAAAVPRKPLVAEAAARAWRKTEKFAARGTTVKANKPAR